MESSDKSGLTKYVVLELLVGVVLSIVYLKIILSKDDDFWGRDYFTGLFRFYIGLSIIFFLSVVVVGIIGAIRLKQSQKIGTAVFYSFAFWILSSVIAVFAANILEVFTFYIVLIGITFGFNYGLRDTHKIPEV